MESTMVAMMNDQWRMNIDGGNSDEMNNRWRMNIGRE
jgi:hypothetical protein